MPPRLSIARPAALLAPLLLALMAPGSAGATMVVPLDLDALTDGAERIAVARVESQEARWTRDHSAIYTEVTLRVLTPLKGGMATGETVTVRREGGVVGNVGMRVTGAARFVDGEEVLVFLERRGEALWTMGMAQGRMPVATQAGQRVVVRATAGLGFVRPPVPEPTVRPLDEVMARINARTRAGGSR